MIRKGAAPLCLPSWTGCRPSRLLPPITRPTNSPQAFRTLLMPTESALTVRWTQVSVYRSSWIQQTIPGLKEKEVSEAGCHFTSSITALFRCAVYCNTTLLMWCLLPSLTASPLLVSSSIHHHHLPLSVCGYVWWHGPWGAHDLCRPLPCTEREQTDDPEKW